MGDWNVKVGSQETSEVTGKFCLGMQNEAGQRLIEFCQENTLGFLAAITNCSNSKRKNSANEYCCRCSVTQSVPTLYDPTDCSTPSFPVHHQLPEFAQTHIQVVMPSNHLILCRPLLLLPSIFPSIRVFFNESALHIR